MGITTTAISQPDQRMSGRSKHTNSLSLAGGKWTAHDLRRTAATMMAEMGISGGRDSR